MIKQLIAQFMQPRHFWRDVQFDELGELYTSMLLKSLGQNILFIFVPFYLYQHGYGVQQIFLMYTCFFAARTVADVGSGFVVARFGPKHTQIAATVIQIISAAQFLTVASHHWSVAQLGAAWGIASSLYFISFHVQFSKIKHTKHAGKEIGYMGIMDKIGAVIGPLIGGVVGNYIDAHYIFLVAGLVLALSLWPLFLTAEPVRTRQTLNFKDLPVAKIKYDVLSYIGLGVENTLCINLWPLYISLFALSGGVYIKLGLISALSVLFAIVVAYNVGKLIDGRNSQLILRRAAVINAGVYVIRPLIHSIGGVVAVNFINEAVTSSYRMPYTKGMYAAADDLPGFRIAYIVVMEAVCSVIKGLFWLILALLAGSLAMLHVIYVGFAFAALGSMLILTERFKVLRG